MRALVVYCHPKEGSFTAAVRDRVLAELESAGAELRITDLYARGFDPVLSAEDFERYNDDDNDALVSDDVADLKWCDTLIFIYPTWWFGLPAIMKGWLDRVFLPEVAFHMPKENETIRPALTHIGGLGLFTTCGASRWLTFFVGAPGKRLIFRGIGGLCARPLKKVFVAHYLMDSSTDESRARHLDKVSAEARRFIAARKGKTK